LIDEAITLLDEKVKESECSNDEILEFLKNQQISKKLSNEYRYFILICGLFKGEKRNIVKLWKTYENLFLSLV
jgi:hypothetical protein